MDSLSIVYFEIDIDIKLTYMLYEFTKEVRQ